MALSTVAVSTFYLTAQMVGAGKLMSPLVGVAYKTAIIGVGILMVGYVVFGGMTATTWVQIIKAVLLVIASFVMVAWSGVRRVQPARVSLGGGRRRRYPGARLKLVLRDGVRNMTPAELGQRFLEPGLLFKSPLDQISLGMALVLGTAGLPHILMRFFTVPTAQAARKSVIIAMSIIGGFYVLTLFLGIGAAIFVGRNAGSPRSTAAATWPRCSSPAPEAGTDCSLGDLMLAFVCCVAFATIVAVVAGLVLAAASAMSHDIWVGVIKATRDRDEELKAARIAR